MLISINGSLIQTDLIYEVTEIQYLRTEGSQQLYLGWFEVHFLGEKTKQFSINLFKDRSTNSIRVLYLPETEKKKLIDEYLEPLREYIIEHIEPNSKIPTFRSQEPDLTKLLDDEPVPEE